MQREAVYESLHLDIVLKKYEINSIVTETTEKKIKAEEQNEQL